jgi:hypothetical protein
VANVDLTPEPPPAGVIGAPGGGPPPLTGVVPGPAPAPAPVGTAPAPVATGPTPNVPAAPVTRGLIMAEPAVSVAGIKVGHGLEGPYLAIAVLGVLGALLVAGVRVVGGR